VYIFSHQRLQRIQKNLLMRDLRRIRMVYLYFWF